MPVYEFTIDLEEGLQARNICTLINLIHSYECKVKIIEEDTMSTLDPVQLMGMTIETGHKISLHIVGQDEEKVMKEIKNFLISSSKTVKFN